MAVSSEYRVNIVISSKDKTSAAAGKAGKSLSGLAAAAKVAAVAYATLKVAQEAIKFVEFGAKVQQAKTALETLATGAGTSGDAIVKAIQTASNFTIDKMTAMSAANKAMLLGVAQTPEEFGRLAKYATLLGRAMGQDAAKSIDDFVVAAGRQSKMIADNLGLMVGAEDANRKYAEKLGKTVDELTDAEKKQAFLNEMLAQAAEKTQGLEGATGGAAEELGIMKAAISDTKSELALMAAETFDNTVNTEKLATAIRDIPDALREAQERQAEFSASLGEAEAYLEGDINAIARYAVVVDTASRSVQNYNGYIADGVSTMDQYRQEQIEILPGYDNMIMRTKNSEAALITLNEQEAEFNALLAKKREALEASTQALKDEAIAMQGFVLDASMRWTDYYRDIDDQAEKFTKDREELEAEHQANIEELIKQGQSYTVEIDEAAEQLKLDILRAKLDAALETQSKFNADTAELTRLQTQQTIANLQTQIGEQESLLSSSYDGLVTMKGKNVDALIAEEDRRHKEAIAGLEEEIAKTQELQRQQLGTLLLQTFESWSEMKDIPAEKMLEMRTAIAKEYGLISEEEAQLVGLSVKTWEEWAVDFSKSSDQVVEDLDHNIQLVRDLQTALGELPSEKVIDIIIRQGGSAGLSPEYVPTTSAQLGPGETTNNTNNNYTMNVNTQASSSTLIEDFELLESLER